MVNNIVMPELTPEEQLELNRKAKRGLLWFGIVSIIMLFAGLTSAYMVRQGEGKWVQFALPDLFILSTILIVLSSLSLQWALTSVKKNNLSNLKIGTFITFVLGIG